MNKTVLAAIAAVACAALPAHAQTYNLTLSGASPGGLWSAIGTGVDAAVAKEYKGSTVTYQTSSGGLANLQLVAQDKVPMGIAQDPEIALAVNGKEPFKSKISNVRTLVRVYAPEARFQMTHLILSKAFADKYGIKTFADIVAKKAPLRVAINRRGNLDGDISEAVMVAMGGTEKAIESWGGQVVRAASKEQVSLYSDRRIDMMNYGIAFNHSSVQEAVKAVDSVLLDIPEAVAAKVSQEFSGEPCHVKAGEYAWSPAPITSFCGGAVIVVNANMDEKLAYNLAKAMIEQIEEFKDKAGRAIKATASAKSLAKASAYPFHPGAAKYYKEKGLM